MADSRDPAIKLFGKTIPLLEISTGVDSTCCVEDSIGDDVRENETGDMDQDRASIEFSEDDSEAPGVSKDSEEEPNQEEEKETELKHDEKEDNNGEDELLSPDAVSGATALSEASLVEKEKTANSSSNSEEKSSMERSLKKPDKILPCPRCNSMETKFCYYNNYNVNQPRHFCKNCQRYWTAGGTMRNVPVGAGRRKNKNSASHYRHITVSESLQNVGSDAAKAVFPPLNTNGTVLSFGSDVPLHESMASALTIADKSLQNGYSETTSRDETTNTTSEQKNPIFVPGISCFPAAPWTYQLNQTMSSAGFVPPGYAVPVFPTPYWGSTMGTAPWIVPWMVPHSPRSGGTSCPNSPTLGKHSRDENKQKQDDVDGSTKRNIWIPKTLRIDDPEEAAKSSIWTTLGIKNEKPDLIGSRALFRSFESKVNEKKLATETSPVLHANPAAFSRSVHFRESS